MEDLIKLLKVGDRVYSKLQGYTIVNYISEDSELIKLIDDKNTVVYNKYGQAIDYPNSESLLSPTEHNNNWESLIWKDGDILESIDTTKYVVFKGFPTNDTILFNGEKEVYNNVYFKNRDTYNVNNYHKTFLPSIYKVSLFIIINNIQENEFVTITFYNLTYIIRFNKILYDTMICNKSYKKLENGEIIKSEKLHFSLSYTTNIEFTSKKDIIKITKLNKN